MKNLISLPLILLIFGINGNLQGQDNSLEMVKQEVKEVTLKEQEAFKNGDCDTVMSLMADNITFHANGRPAVPKSVVERFCYNIPRPFQKASKQNLSVYPLNKDVAYVVRTLEYDKNEEVKISETVTKIWNRIDGKWMMVHLQSTIIEVPKKG